MNIDLQIMDLLICIDIDRVQRIRVKGMSMVLVPTTRWCSGPLLRVVTFANGHFADGHFGGTRGCPVDRTPNEETREPNICPRSVMNARKGHRRATSAHRTWCEYVSL